ncbi:Outer membrane protein assembly factor BamA [compost metagenome]
MRQMEGGWASTYLIDQSKTRLERLGYFKEVNVETPQVAGTDDQVDVNYTVEEQPSGSITASVGFAQNAGLILGGSISQNNFLGTGNKVSIGLTRSEYQSRYSFGFVDPYWTVDGVSLGWNAFYRTTDYDDLDVDVSSYAVDSYGVGMSIGYPISETARLTFGLTAQQDDINTGVYTVDEIMDFIDQEGDNYLNFKASAGWSESTLNKGVMATRGHSQSLVLETTIPGSDLSFYKLDYRGQIFKPLTQQTALRFHTELGYGDAYGSTSELPFYEHYYAGGFNSVRGFEDSSLGPRSTPSVARDANGAIITDGTAGADGRYTDPDQDPLPFGGNVLIQGGVEYLFPLPFVKDQRQLRTVLFWDVGNVFDTNCSSSQKNSKANDSTCDIDFNNLASSVGVGLTWITALGPLSFSLGMPIKKPDDADTQVFQFSLGQTF